VYTPLVWCVKKREEKNKRIWDLREKRHKGVEKGDKASLWR
jgi:hypothetical protein